MNICSDTTQQSSVVMSDDSWQFSKVRGLLESTFYQRGNTVMQVDELIQVRKIILPYSEVTTHNKVAIYIVLVYSGGGTLKVMGWGEEKKKQGVA